MKSELERHCHGAVEQYCRWSGSTSMVVAVSGGVDSMVLLHLLAKIQPELKLNLVVAHLEHGLRGEESRADARLVIQTCERLGIPCYARFVDEHFWQRQAGNFQDKARALRYTFFRQVGTDFFSGRAFAIATAMTQDDCLEKIFMDILRGRSLLGSLSHQQPDTLRPLRTISKEALIAYATGQQISWREDTSNHQDSYLRNRVRNQLIPLLREEFDFQESIQSRFITDMEEGMTFLSEQLDALFASLLREGSLRVSDLRQLASFPQRQICLRFLQHHGIPPSEEKLALFIRLLTAKGTRSMDAGGGRQLVIAYENIRVSDHNAVAKPVTPLTVVSCGEFSLNGKQLRLTQFTSQSEKRFSLPANLVIFPLIIRSRRPGDTLALPGGHVKLKKALIDRKIPRQIRDSLVVVENRASQIIFVEGIGAILPRKNCSDTLEYTVEIL